MSFHSLFPHSITQQFNHLDDDGTVPTVPIKSFAGALAAQLLILADMEEKKEKERCERKRLYSILDSASGDGDETVSTITLPTDINVEKKNDDAISYLLLSGKRINNCMPVKEFLDGNGNLHTLAKFPIIQTGLKQKKRSIVQSCHTCKKESTMFCVQCGQAFCFSEINRVDMDENVFNNIFPQEVVGDLLLNYE